MNQKLHQRLRSELLLQLSALMDMKAPPDVVERAATRLAAFDNGVAFIPCE